MRAHCVGCQSYAARRVFGYCEACAPGVHLASLALKLAGDFINGARRIAANRVARVLNIHALGNDL